VTVGKEPVTVDTLLFYTPGTCALACMIALEWLSLPYSVCLVTKEERSGESFKRINPRGQVPTLRVDGRILTEVNAILAHVADKKPEARLLPPNGTWARDVANQWLSTLGTGVHPAFWPFYGPQKYTTDPNAHESVKAAAVIAIRRELGAIDVHLSSNEYILGSELTVLDGYLFSMARWGTDMLDLAKDLPNVFRHHKLLAASPIVRRCTAIERGRELPTPSSALIARQDLSMIST
jgi:glutathione S-transferase